MVKEENAILPAQELRSLPPEQALSAKLLAARNDRKRGVQYLSAEQVLSDMDHAIARAPCPENSASFGRKAILSNMWVT